MLYEVVATTTLSHYLSYHDEDGALGRIVQDCIESLGTCLEHVQSDSTLRQQILSAIFSMHRFDVDHGGFGLTKDIPPQLLQTTTVEEKSLIAQWVRTALADLQHTSQESVWRRQRYGGLLLALEGDRLSDEAFLQIGRETKNIEVVVNRLLQLHRVDESVQEASQANGWQVVKLADLFVQYGQDRAVEALMDEKARQEQHTQVAQWLQNHYLAKGHAAAALEMAELIFLRRPWMSEYQQMRELALQLGTWKEVRQAACKFLEATRNSSLLVAIALDEGDEARALQLLEAATPHGPDGIQWKYDYIRTPEGALQAAERAEDLSPHAAIDLYQQHVEHLIAGRGRGNYQAACHYLKKIQALYEKLHKTEQWIIYLDGVRKRHSRLATLKEELNAADLL